MKISTPVLILLSLLSGVSYSYAEISPTVPQALKNHAADGGVFTPENPLTMWYVGCKWGNDAEMMSSYDASESQSIMQGNGQMGLMHNGDNYHHVKINEKGQFQGDQNIFSDARMYQSIGKLAYNTSNSFSSNCIHQLDLATGVYTEVGKTSDTYVNNQLQPATTQAIEWFMSYPDQVGAGHITSAGKGELNYSFTLSGSASESVTTSITGNYADAEFSGKVSNGIVSYSTRLRVIASDGSVSVSSGAIKVEGASEITVLLSTATDFDPSSSTTLSSTVNPDQLTLTRINAAMLKGWDMLYSRHVSDHGSLFNSMSLKLDGQANDISTQKMIDGYTSSSLSKGQKLLYENLVFAFGRYLEIAASRPYDKTAGIGLDCPSLLQGIWQGSNYGMWNDDIHADINVQMNYWPAEPTNLSVTHLAFINWIKHMSQSALWKQLASEAGCEGWSCLTAMNPFGGGNNYYYSNKNDGYSMHYHTAQAWLCSHVIQHYLYTLDDAYLAEMMPVLWQACEFWAGHLVKDTDGLYVVQNEHSPEQDGQSDGKGAPHAQQMVTYLIKHTLEFARAKGVPSGSSLTLERLQSIYDNLDNGLHSWQSGGTEYLREFKHTDTFGIENHRHLSHLTCLYPLGQVHPGDDMFDATVNALLSRGLGVGDSDPAVWTLAWKVCNWAMARDKRAYEIFRNAIGYYQESSSKTGLYKNLVSYNQTVQLEGNWGLTAGVAEMLMQSNRSQVMAADPYAYIDIAPVLPDDWKNGGEVKGLKAQGNFEVGYTWDSDGVAEITIKCLAASPVPLYVHYDNFTAGNTEKYYVAKGNRNTAPEKGVWTAEFNKGNEWLFNQTGGSVIVIKRKDIADVPDPEPETAVLEADDLTLLPGADNAATLRDNDGATLMKVMFGDTDLKVFKEGSFVNAYAGWNSTAIDDSHADNTDYLNNGTAVPAAEGTWRPYTEVNGTMAASPTLSSGGLFLAPVAGAFIRLEPYVSGEACVTVSHTSTVYVVDETGRRIDVTADSGSGRSAYTFTAAPGKTYYIGAPDDKIGFAAVTFTPDDNTSDNTLVINENSPMPALVPGTCYDVTLRRTFTKGFWHPVVLPFAVSESMMRDTFGKDVKVFYLDPQANTVTGGSGDWYSAYRPAVDGTTLSFTIHHYQMLLAGTPAFVCPSQNVTDPHIGYLTCSESDVNAYAIGSGYEVTGNYNPSSAADNGEIYYISNSTEADNRITLYHAGQGIDMKGIRAWIRAVSGAAPALRSIAFGSYGSEDTASAGIVVSDGTISADDDNVYDMLGRIVGRHSTQGLRPGIYIHRGQKIILR